MDIWNDVDVLRRWFDCEKKEKTPGTIRSYLGSVLEFLAFLKFKGADRTQVTEMEEALGRWRRSMSRPTAIRRVEVAVKASVTSH